VQLGNGGQMVNYTNMTPLTNTGAAANAVFKLPDGTVVASLDAAGGMIQLVSGNGAFETTTFAAPSGSLTVNSGNGADTITPTANFYDTFGTNLVVNGAANTLSLRGATTGTLAATEGAALTQTVATFRDPNGAGAAGAYSATIDWGDGTSGTSGTISGPDAGGVFSVTGTHTYAEEQTAGATATVALHRSGAADVTVTDTVQLADPPLSGKAATVTATAQATFSGVVASFTDGNPAATAGDFTATIDWGDGTTTAGSVSAASGNFLVTGSHAYAAGVVKEVVRSCEPGLELLVGQAGLHLRRPVPHARVVGRTVQQFQVVGLDDEVGVVFRAVPDRLRHAAERHARIKLPAPVGESARIGRSA
jgi:hypothetical protein